MDIEQKWREAQAIQQKMQDRERERRHKPIPKAVRKQVYEKYNGHCAYCGRPIDYKDMQVDHIKAKYAGGAEFTQDQIGQIIDKIADAAIKVKQTENGDKS